MRSPILDVAPSFCLPPVDLLRSVRPSQATKSRPFGKGFDERCQSSDRGGGDWADAGNSHQSARYFVIASTSCDLLVRSAILPLRLASRSNINRNMALAASGSEPVLFFLDEVGKHRHMRRPLGCDPSMLSEESLNRVDELGPLPH